MGWLRTLVVAGAALSLSGPLARAADMPRDYLPPPPPPRVVDVIESSGGWYIRGDLGGTWGTGGTPQANAPLPNPGDNRFGKGFTGGLGVGYKSRWLRTDFTADYMAPMQYTGTMFTAGDTTAKLQASTVLFNGYLDLGTWYRITPYIGAGAGAAYVRANEYAAPFFAGDNARQQWNFAWAAMAGLAFPIAPNVQVDAGYRYVNAGDIGVGGNAIGGMTFKNIAAHQVRVGLRWSFDDLYIPR